MKYSIYLGFLWSFMFSSWVNAQPMTSDMHDLCSRADRTDFFPLPESITSPNPDPLFHAIEMGADYKAVQSLIGDKHPDNIVIQKVTPLVVAAVTGNWPAAQALIDRGANINLGEPDLLTNPLLAAVLRSRYSVACKLIERHAKFPFLKSDRDYFFLNAQSAEPDLQNDAATFVDFLLMNGFDPNGQGTGTQTPLMVAISFSNIPVIKVLLKHGARLDTVTKDGRTVWTVARKKNNPQVLKLLAEAQAKAAVEKAKNAKELVTQ